MNRKLIATDMDGTLLNSNHKLDFENKKYIIDFQKKGNTFVLASGRPTYAMLDVAEELEMKKYQGYILSFNGAIILDLNKNEIIYSKKVEKSDIIDMYNYANENNLCFLTYNDDNILVNIKNEYAMVEEKITGGKLKLIENIYEIDFSKTIKCMLLGEPEKLIFHEEKLKNSKYSKKLFFSRSMPFFLEVVNKEVNKGNSIKELIKILNIEKKDTFSVGDSYNDIPLLKETGISIAPFNAKEEIKEIVNYVGVSNDDGIIKDLIIKYELL